MLEKIQLFEGLSADQLVGLEKACKQIKRPANTTVITEGDEDDSLYLIISGSVNVFISNEQGEGDTILRTLDEGNYFGELSIIDGLPRSASVRTTSQTHFLVLMRNDFLNFLEKHSEVHMVLLTNLAANIRNLTGDLVGYAQHNVYFRLKKLLLELADNSGIIHELPSQSVIGKRIGSTRERVNKLLKALEEGQYIEKQPLSGQKFRVILLKELPRDY